MASDNAAKKNDAIEVIEIAIDSQQEGESAEAIVDESSVAPAIRVGRRRPQAVPQPIAEEEEFPAYECMASEPSTEQDTQQEQLSRAPGEPPLFTGILQIEPKELKQWQKALKSHKKCSNMKKLSTLDYFAMRYSEIAYFEVSPDAAALVGMLGYGNIQLVTQIKDQLLSEELLPSLFGVLTGNECYTGPIEGLRAEDQQGLSQIGFQSTQFVGAFPVLYKKSITGLWICGSSGNVEISEKELKELKKQFTDFVF